MCRLAIMNTRFVQNVGDIYLTALFAELETKLGGHGMGVVGVSKDIIIGDKGVAMTPEQAGCCAYSWSNIADYIVFHTRLATVGSQVKANCQPFFDIGSTVLAHNGTVLAFRSNGVDKSDSRIIYEMVNKYRMSPTRFLDSLSGVFVGTQHGYPFVVKPSSYGDLSLIHSHDLTEWCFLSNIPYTCRLQDYEMIHNIGACCWQGPELSQSFIDQAKGKAYEPYRNYYDYTGPSIKKANKQ